MAMRWILLELQPALGITEDKRESQVIGGKVESELIEFLEQDVQYLILNLSYVL